MPAPEPWLFTSWTGHRLQCLPIIVNTFPDPKLPLVLHGVTAATPDPITGSITPSPQQIIRADDPGTTAYGLPAVGDQAATA